MADMAVLISQVVEGLLFGSAWYFGFLLFCILSIALLRMWKYSGAILIPLLLILETEYYERYTAATAEASIWPMIAIGILIITIAVYTISAAAQKGE